MSGVHIAGAQFGKGRENYVLSLRIGFVQGFSDTGNQRGNVLAVVLGDVKFSLHRRRAPVQRNDDGHSHALVGSVADAGKGLIANEALSKMCQFETCLVNVCVNPVDGPFVKRKANKAFNIGVCAAVFCEPGDKGVDAEIAREVDHVLGASPQSFECLTLGL